MNEFAGEYRVCLTEIPGCGIASTTASAHWGALVSLANDISPVFPYLNAKMTNVWYFDHEKRFLILRESERGYAFRPREIRVAGVAGLFHAQRTAAEIVERISAYYLTVARQRS